MAKILFLVVLLLVGLLVWRLLSRGAPRREDPPPALPPQRIVKCAVCDVHVPEYDAVAHQDRYFCGAAHLQEFSRRNPG